MSFHRYLGTVFLFSYKNLLRRRWRTILTTLSLIAAIIGFVCTVNISESIGFELTSGEAERALFAGIDVGYPYFSDIIITAKHPWWYDLPISEPFRGSSYLLPENLLAEVRTIPGIEWAEPYVGDVKIQFVTTVTGGQEIRKEWVVRHENGSVERFSSDILIAGVDPIVEPKRLGKNILILQGRDLQEASQEVIVGYNFAESHNLSVGDTLIIPAENHLFIHDSPGKLIETSWKGAWYAFWSWFEDQWQERFSISINKEVSMKIVGIFWTTTLYDNYVVTNYDDLRQILGFGSRVTCIFVKLNPEADVGQTLNALWSLQNVKVYIPLIRKRYTTGRDQVGSTFSGIAPTKFAKVANLQNIITSEVATGTFIAAVVYTTVLERRWEIGLLKALGFKATFILSTLMAEALILGLLAGVIGFLASAILSVLSTGLLLPTGGFIPLLSSILPKIELKLTFEWGIMAIGVSTATSLVSSLIPALLAARLPPIEAMRRG